MNTQGLLSTAEVAALLGVHVSTVSRKVKAEDLTPALRIGGGSNGGAMFFRRRDVERLLARQDAA